MTPGPPPFPAAARDDRALAAMLAMFVGLAIVAAAFGLGVAGSAGPLGRPPGHRLTVQVPAAAANRALGLLRTAPGVARATPVDPATMRRLLRPWLGDDADNLSLPVLIDVDLADPAAGPAIEHRLRGSVAVIRIDAADRWLAPLADLVRLLTRVAVTLVVLPVIAIPLIARRAARRMLARQHATIATIHALGATDRQIAAPFRRRIVIGALAGAAIGSIGALAIVMPVDTAIAAAGSDVMAAAALDGRDWAMLAVLPVALALLAIAAAGHMVAHTLERMA